MTEEKHEYIGDEITSSNRSLLKVRDLVERGEVKDFEALMLLLKQILQKEMDEPQRIFWTEPQVTSRGQREKITEMVFEEFNLPYLQFAPSGLLSLFSAGFTTGLVIECGEGLTQSHLSQEGQMIKAASATLPLGGKDINDYLSRSLLPALGH